MFFPLSSSFSYGVTYRVQPILWRGMGMTDLISAVDGQLVLLLPCREPGLVTDEAPLPWS